MFSKHLKFGLVSSVSACIINNKFPEAMYIAPVRVVFIFFYLLSVFILHLLKKEGSSSVFASQEYHFSPFSLTILGTVPVKVGCGQAGFLALKGDLRISPGLGSTPPAPEPNHFCDF